MTWVKICGITNLADALTAVDAGADALGFIFYEKSSRKIDPETARRIVKQLPLGIETVGVFVLQNPVLQNPVLQNSVLQNSQPPLQIAEDVGLSSLQIHIRWSLDTQPNRGSDVGAAASAAPRKWYPALPAASFFGESLEAANMSLFVQKKPERTFDRVLLDSGTSDQPGGTGRVFDWEKAAPRFQQIGKDINVIAAGGLNPTNVADAIRVLRPWGVDVASGVEAAAGKKDPEKVRAFVRTVRETGKCA
ncbi:MAG TPA: phosphoribosylanthranilate isomerase [Terriglobales bacterium]|jgi:phosphoribosylanthranilate isomerase|nr:phosphoribosylanthranilate isomerase [Terriglobales bacterium]